MKRRSFVKNTSYTLSALPLLKVTLSKNNYKLALIGCGWWGNNILDEALAYGFLSQVALCDVDANALKATREKVTNASSLTCKTFEDYRECIENVKPDIVIIATPDHWHALPAIAAIKSGSHVYLEKPIGHTIGEGRAILNAARQYGRIVQVDTHRRMSPHNISAMEFLRSGKAGEIHSVKAFVNYSQRPQDKQAETDVPRGLNWDMWCGPAPYRNYHPGIHPRGFRQYLDYANGTIGDWGIHWFDQVLWWTEEKYPKKIFSIADRFIKRDNSDAPDTQYASYEFESFTLNWEHKLCAGNHNEKSNVGCYFYGTEGTLHLGWRDGWTFYPRSEKSETIHVDPVLHTKDGHNIKELWVNFINSIENNKEPVCDILHGHLATNISLLGMISAQLGESIEWDGEKEVIINNQKANQMLTREYRSPWNYPVR